MIEVEVEDAAWSALADVEALVTQAAGAALEGCDGEITVLLTSDAEVADLNGRFRGKPGSTNVLSFPAAPQTCPWAVPHLGDIALAHGVCAREAAAQGKPLAHHLQHLVVHGVLHLLGSDHQDDAEAEAMEAAERAILDRLGVPDPYAATDARSAAAPDEA